MTRIVALFLASLVAIPLAFAPPDQPPAPSAAPTYSWLEGRTPARDLAAAIPPPAGYARVAVDRGSFAEWLRHLPAKTNGAPVLLFDGRPKPTQALHALVIDVDVGTRDLQQCADAVIRLRAEYQFARGAAPAVSFDFTSGDAAPFARWSAGGRPSVRGERVIWTQTAAPDASHASFRRYLDVVFTYAGTRSLERQLSAPKDPRALAIGDVFIHGGSPGHAMLVVDLAEDRATGRRALLLAQGYMPAQEIHVVANPRDPARSPWYDAEFGEHLVTPEWTFGRDALRGWP